MNSGNIFEAINKTVISGTPLQISIKIVHKIETTGSLDLLPRASITPIGRDNTIPTPAITNVKNNSQKGWFGGQVPVEEIASEVGIKASFDASGNFKEEIYMDFDKPQFEMEITEDLQKWVDWSPELRTMVHGDDFVAVGSERDLAATRTVLGNKYNISQNLIVFCFKKHRRIQRMYRLDAEVFSAHINRRVFSHRYRIEISDKL